MDLQSLKTKKNLKEAFLRELGINDISNLVLCHNCLKIISKKEFPSINVKNGLTLEEIPEELKLEDLEQQLIARNLLFIKVKRLRHGMRAFKDAIINVPLEDEDVGKNMTNLLPRHPDDAHLVCVQLKRKVEYNNSHLAGFIRPNIVLKALQTLKDRGNKYYQHVIINENFMEKEEGSPEGQTDDHVEDVDIATTDSQILEKERDEAWELEEKMAEEQRQANNVSDSEDEDDTSLKSVKKQQTKQVNTFLMPEDLANQVIVNNGPSKITKDLGEEKQSITIAPGEGKVPTPFLRWTDFDVQAFPKHHPNGQFGLHHQRKKKLTSQMYFNQRLMNQDERFSKDPCYLFMACYYLERQMIENQINIAGVRGVSRFNAEGQRKVHLDDMFSVFSKIKGTPKYWQVARNELVAKVKQLGPFHVFFTFSCGEMKWTEVYLNIFRRKGYKIDYPDDWDGHDEDILVEGVPIWTYINEVMSDTKHALFKDYVFLITRLFDARVKSFIKNILMAGGNDKVPFKYFSYRVEFQARGMPHIHGVAWISPEYLHKNKLNGHLCDLDENKLIDLVESLVTCEIPENDENLKNLVQSQMHGHTGSCLKYNGKCRYGFPKLPSEKTIVAQPLPETLDKEERKKMLEDAKNTLTKAMDLLNSPDLDENMSLEDFVKTINPELSKEEYMRHISITERGKTVILKRTLKERMANNYNKEMLTAWKANMDIQVALDPYAIITYIVSYVNKDDSGLTKFMQETLTKIPANKDTKEKLKALKTTYLTHRQIGASEAVYRVVPSMKLKDSNIKCIFVSSGFPQNRSVFYRKVNDTPNDELHDYERDDEGDDDCQDEDGSEDEENEELVSIMPPEQIEGREGNYQKAINVIDRYAARPKYLKDMCLAQFATSYTYQSKSPKTAIYDEDGNSEKKSLQKIFNCETNLPTHIALKDGLGKMRLRFEPAVLRIHTSKKKEDHERHYSEMLLFSPWTDEENELPQDENECLAEYIERREVIDSNREAIYPGEPTIDLLEGEDLAMMRPTHLLETLDNQGDQENNDDLEEGSIDDPDFESFAYTGNLQQEGCQQFEDFKYKEICLPNDFELKHMTRQLVPEQMNVMRQVLSACKDIQKAEKYPKIKRKPVRLILHGGAGVGKSQTTRVVAMQAEKVLRKAGHHPNRPRVLLSAFTGKAASLIGKLKFDQQLIFILSTYGISSYSRWNNST